MDGTNRICDHNTVERELGEITPINTEKAAQAIANSRNTKMKSGALTGMGALKISPEAMVITAATMVR